MLSTTAHFIIKMDQKVLEGSPFISCLTNVLFKDLLSCDNMWYCVGFYHSSSTERKGNQLGKDPWSECENLYIVLGEVFEARESSFNGEHMNNVFHSSRAGVTPQLPLHPD